MVYLICPQDFTLCPEFALTMDPRSPASLFHLMQGIFSWTIAKPQTGFDIPFAL